MPIIPTAKGPTIDNVVNLKPEILLGKDIKPILIYTKTLIPKISNLIYVKPEITIIKDLKPNT
jgi:hypothetical protein